MKTFLTFLVLILLGAGIQAQTKNELITCRVVEQVNPVTPEFALSCDCQTLYTVECPTRNRRCSDDDKQPDCVKTTLDIPNSKWPKAWNGNEYVGAVIFARWEDKSLVAVSATYNKKRQP